MKAPKELFLSHSARNRRFATDLANCLRDHGIPVWYSKTTFAKTGAVVSGRYTSTYRWDGSKLA